MKTLFANQKLQPNMSATSNCHPSLLHVLGTAFHEGHRGTFACTVDTGVPFAACTMNTSVKRTLRVGPCLCLLPLFDSPKDRHL